MNYSVHHFKVLIQYYFKIILRLFVLAYAIAANVAINEAGIKNNKKYFLPRGKIENYNVLIDGRNFMINPLII